jgi:kynurenine formamidase
MPVYPGTEPPLLKKACTLEADGFRETLLSLYSHTGTHMDAPAHMLAEGITLDKMAPDRFVGPGAVLDFSVVAAGGRIGVPEIRAHLPRLAGADFVLLRTGWDRLWGDPAYFEGFPCLTPEAAELLAALPLKGLGVDAISVDPVDSTTFDVHLALLGRGMVILENLTRLSELGEVPFLLAALPLRYAEADGAPIRAVAVMKEEERHG